LRVVLLFVKWSLYYGSVAQRARLPDIPKHQEKTSYTSALRLHFSLLLEESWYEPPEFKE